MDENKDIKADSKEKTGKFSNRKIFGLIVVLALVIAMPFVVKVSENNTDTRQRAASSENLLPAGPNPTPNFQAVALKGDPEVGRFEIPVVPVETFYTLEGKIKDVKTIVEGTPYQAEVAVDIYDVAGANGNYANRVIVSSDTLRNRNIPLAFTVPANYKAYVIYRVYNATATFDGLSLISGTTGQGVNLIPSNLRTVTFTNNPTLVTFDIPTSLVARTFTLLGIIKDLKAIVGGTPYQAEVAVDIYDAVGANGNYANRMIVSNDALRNKTNPLTFTVPANYKAYVMYRLYNATATFSGMNLSSDVSSAPTAVLTPVPSEPVPFTSAFDTRTFVKVGNVYWESITAGNYYWNFQGNNLVGRDNLSGVSKYWNGPCSKLVCKFDTRTFAPVADANGNVTKWIESITVGDKIWDIDGNTPVSGSPVNLTDIPRYRDGPCRNQGAACHFDTRTYVQVGNAYWESVTAGDNYWNFQGNNLLSTGTLTSVERYRAGPCLEQASCKFDTRTFAPVADANGNVTKWIESITVGSIAWNFDGNTPVYGSPVNLMSVGKYNYIFWSKPAPRSRSNI